MANKKTHIVLDLLYTPEEGQDCFDGTFQECMDFISKQGGSTYMYEIIEMTKEQIENHPDNQKN